MKECEGHLGRVEFDQIIREVYSDIFSPYSDTDLGSSSSGFVEIVMEMTESYVDQKVLSYDHSTIEASDISKLWFNVDNSSTKNEGHVVLEPCMDGERVCICGSKGVSDEYF